METKVLFAMLLSLLLFTNGASLSVHRMQASHDLANGHERGLGFHAMPRKLMLEQKVIESVKDMKLASYDETSSGQPHKGEEETLKVTKQEGFDSTRAFTMDYTPMRRRRPVHNKSSPAAAASP
uniref:protein GOLVEN 6-like n=1 Tax=Erigeron canadensis TaxID=72917 RepID=UPI001CB9CA05|nr:protein GOLVEN 6-like [Erigeron canadensis]